MANRRVGFITSADFAALYEDDRLAVPALEAAGWSVEPVVWTQVSDEALAGFDAVVLRSPWDWFHRRQEFRRFLARLASARTRVFNAPSLLAAYADKTYLPLLEAKGVPVVPTVLVPTSQLGQVPAVLEARGWGEAVLKPAFTAGAFDAHRFLAGEAAAVTQRLPALAEGEQWLLQPFLPGIAEGELSFVFFLGAFSHALRKRPKAGEWRVQELYGGSSERVEPAGELVAQARAVLEVAAPGALQARVDGVVLAGRFHLMELELVEPDLFFRLDRHAPERFARALVTATAT